MDGAGHGAPQPGLSAFAVMVAPCSDKAGVCWRSSFWGCAALVKHAQKDDEAVDRDGGDEGAGEEHLRQQQGRETSRGRAAAVGRCGERGQGCILAVPQVGSRLGSASGEGTPLVTSLNSWQPLPRRHICASMMFAHLCARCLVTALGARLPKA
jgi:hypothetical protein